jgi:phenylalanyl-tRNA synthetase beta chain
MSLSLVSAADLERAGLPGVGIEVENPLRAEESILRPAVLPGLLASVAFNASHGRPDAAVFEVGHVFLPPPDGQVLPDERERIAVALSGTVAGHPHDHDRVVDVYDAVGVLEVLVQTLGLSDWDLHAAVRPGFHPGRCAAVFVDGIDVGTVGEVAPEVVASMDLPANVVAFEVDSDRMLASGRKVRRYVPVSRYPASAVDLAFVVPDDESSREVERTLVEAGGALIDSVDLFDVFRADEVLGEDRRSLAFRVQFRAPDRTLTDADTAALRQACIDAVTSRHRADLRG